MLSGAIDRVISFWLLRADYAQASAPCGPLGAEPSGRRWGGTAQHGGGHHNHGGKSSDDARQLVHFPAELREHTLANMRDHLLVLQAIQAALALKQEDKAARIAEERLGMASLPLHGAHEVAKYMRQDMRDIGTAMHRAASRFAIEAQNGAVTGGLRPALEAQSQVTAQCVGCHAGYRLN